MHRAVVHLKYAITPSKCTELRYAKLSFQLVTRIPYGCTVDPSLDLSLTHCTRSVVVVCIIIVNVHKMLGN